jgi:hypothetical protein
MFSSQAQDAQGLCPAYFAAQSFVSSVSGAGDLTVAKKVDQTVDALLGFKKLFRGLVGMGSAVCETISNAEVRTGEYLDPEDRLIDDLEIAASKFYEQIARMTAGKASIDRDAKLRNHQRDVLHTAYDEAIEALEMLHETTQNIRAAVIKRDLAAEPRNGEVFGTVAELRNAMS